MGLILNSSAFHGKFFKIPLREFLFLNFTRNAKWNLCTEVGGGKLGGWDRHILSPDFILRNKTLL